MLWTAPEILIERNNADDVFVPGTQQGDVYSFAIIVQEILYRQGPFYISEHFQPSPKGLYFVSFRRFIFDCASLSGEVEMDCTTCYERQYYVSYAGCH